MTQSLKALLVGAAALTLAAALPASARENQPHIMAVHLPDGGVARIVYYGDTPPQLVLSPAPARAAMPMIDLPPALAEFERISAAMDQEADMMLRQAMALPALTQAGWTHMPAGVHVYTAESTFTSNGACTRRTEITFSGNAAPHEVSSLSGDCGPAKTPERVGSPVPNHTARLIEASARHTYRPSIRDAVSHQEYASAE